MTGDWFFNIKLPFTANITDATGGASMRDLSTVMAGIIYAIIVNTKMVLLTILQKWTQHCAVSYSFFPFDLFPLKWMSVPWNAGPSLLLFFPL